MQIRILLVSVSKSISSFQLVEILLVQILLVNPFFFWFPSTHGRQNERAGAEKQNKKTYDSGELLSSVDAP